MIVWLTEVSKLDRFLQNVYHVHYLQIIQTVSGMFIEYGDSKVYLANYKFHTEFLDLKEVINTTFSNIHPLAVLDH